MTNKEKIRQLEARVVELEAEILRLKTNPPTVIIQGSLEPFITAIQS